MGAEVTSLTAANTVFGFTATSIDGELIPLARYRGNVLLIVNVASQCLFTGQYTQLQSLHTKYESKGLTVMGFPCNQFMGQEPKSEQQIKDFCSLRYDVSFQMFAKIDVNGPGTHPLYQYLKSHAKGWFGSETIKWNFTKFLVGRDGNVLGRFAPTTSPRSLEQAIEKALRPTA